MVKTSIANLAWLSASAPAWIAFGHACEDPAREQERLLRQYLHAGVDTVFGSHYRLREIKTYAKFAERVPIQDYDQLLPWFERIRRGEQRVLTRDRVLRLVPTSGSTAARKLIPYTNESHCELNRAIGPWIFDLYRQVPRATFGCSYWSVTPLAAAVQKDTGSAVPIGFGDDSAYLGKPFQRMIDAAMAVPAALHNIHSIKTLRYVTLLLLLRRRNLALISVWHPSFLQLLFDALRDDFNQLATDVAQGSCSVAQDVPASLQAHILSRPNPARAKEIEAAGAEELTKIWPSLSVVSCWADAHAAPASMALRSRVPGVVLQPKGLIATEGIVSIPFAGAYPLAVRSHFFEFIDPAGRIVLAPALKVAETYGVVMTTAGGLWRYRLNDLVHVTGKVGRTPSVRFAGKANLVSDRMGEKLSEGFVIEVLARLFTEHPPQPSFAMLAPDQDAQRMTYTLYIDAVGFAGLETRLDSLLAENPHYAYCRSLGQLGPVRVRHVNGDAYLAFCARLQKQGQRLGDIKPAALSRLDGWARFFEPCVSRSNKLARLQR